MPNCAETEGLFLYDHAGRVIARGSDFRALLHVSLLADYHLVSFAAVFGMSRDIPKTAAKETNYHYQKLGTTRNVTSPHIGQWFAYQAHTSHVCGQNGLEAGGVSYKIHR